MSITITTAGNGTTESSAISSKIELSCPQSAEQKDTEIMDEQIANSSSKTAPTITTTDETDDKADCDYNPNEETQPESEDITSDEESAQEQEQEDEYDEEAIVNSLEFQKEFVAAIENVKYIARCDRDAILSKIKETNTNEIGEEEADEAVTKAFETFTIEESEVSASEESEYDSCDERVVEEEYSEAIEHIRELGKIDGEIFANEICDTYFEFNNQEITIEELKKIFGKIRNNFAEEAKEEFMELNDAESDSDSDYDENNEQDIEQFKRDNIIDKKTKIEIVFVESESDVSESEVSDDVSSGYSEEECDDYVSEKDEKENNKESIVDVE